ncbi:MAG: hypothetical protein KF901_33360 [Myxococcales bacterium]|nr:hypothetical protein [Myxococcales bacterium]
MPLDSARRSFVIKAGVSGWGRAKSAGGTDPDSDGRSGGEETRRWRYLYNRVGELVAMRDPRGCRQSLYYDRAGRRLAEDYGGCYPIRGGCYPIRYPIRTRYELAGVRGARVIRSARGTNWKG